MARLTRWATCSRATPRPSAACAGRGQSTVGSTSRTRPRARPRRHRWRRPTRCSTPPVPPTTAAPPRRSRCCLGLRRSTWSRSAAACARRSTSAGSCDHAGPACDAGSYEAGAQAPDTTNPVVTVPANITTPATSPAGATVTYTASANDDRDGPLTPTCNPASGSTFPVGTTTVTCTATDAAGNTGTASFTVTVTPVVVPNKADLKITLTGPATTIPNAHHHPDRHRPQPGPATAVNLGHRHRRHRTHHPVHQPHPPAPAPSPSTAPPSPAPDGPATLLPPAHR